ncbi:MAG: exodeoxyribonuclease V subunit gamma, partial [Clostridia bacterium]|nr:exodeoxyribonuclease V subunit gamma [Clostridia bacterium]
IQDTHVDANVVTRQIGSYLYRYTTDEQVECGNFVELFQGETRYNEVYNLACQVQKYVRSGGRFRDVYVVTSDVNKYSNAISTVFEQLQIPYFCDNQFALSNQPYAQFVLDYLNIYRNNGRLQNVLSFVKNYLFSGDFDGQTAEDDVYKFENYCLKYNVSYRYDSFTLGLEDYFYPGANAFRQKFNTLYKLVVLPQAAKAIDYVAAIRSLMEVQNLANKNAILAERQANAGNATQANVTTQSVEKFEQVLVQAETILGNRFVTLEEFTKALAAAVASVKISVIPQHNDCVVFANMAKARKHDIKFLALLGANYGVMPIVKKDCKLLTDANIKDLESANIFVEPQIYIENKRERFSLFQLLQEPTDKLYISYPTTDGADSLTPSPFVEQLCSLFTSFGKPLAVSDAEIEEIFTEKQAVAKVILNKRKLADQQMVKMPSFNILSNIYAPQADKYQFAKDGQNITIEGGDRLFFKSSRTSVSQLTQFFSCPYKFYLQYGLNAKPREIAQLKSNDLGTILHDVLEHYVKMVDVAEDNKTTIDKANICFDKALSSDFYTAMKNDAKMRGILTQLRAEAVQMCKVVKKQLAHSKFKNIATELNFDGKDEDGHAPMVTIDYGQGKFNLNGKIDRVDGYGNHLIIIDYKSGEAASNYTEKSLYDGQKLQLLVYLQAAQDFYKMRPVGFYYFNMHNDFVQGTNENLYTYNGRTL